METRFLFIIFQVATRSATKSGRKRSVDTLEGDGLSDVDSKPKKTKKSKDRGGQLPGAPNGSSKRQSTLKQEDSNIATRSNTKTHPSIPSAGGQSATGQRIFTIGHGTRTLQELIDILQPAGVTKLADVRSIPRSRTNPQFNRETLEESPGLEAAGIEYIWLGEQIGGRRNKQQPGLERHTAIRVDAFRNYAGYMCTEGFREGLAGLKSMAWEMNNNGFIAYMCSETLWWRCHRRMISDTLAMQGWDVRHLGVQKEPTPHKIWDIARMSEDGELIYDAEESSAI